MAEFGSTTDTEFQDDFARHSLVFNIIERDNSLSRVYGIVVILSEQCADGVQTVSRKGSVC
jgi:hypothetical protein